MLGNLTLAAIPLDQPIPLIAAGLVGAVRLAGVGWVVRGGCQPDVWRGWWRSVVHMGSRRWPIARPATCRPSITTRSSRPTAR